MLSFVLDTILAFFGAPLFFGGALASSKIRKFENDLDRERGRERANQDLLFHKTYTDLETEEDAEINRYDFEEITDLIEKNVDLHGYELSIFCSELQAQLAIYMARRGKLINSYGQGMKTGFERMTIKMYKKIPLFCKLWDETLRNNGFPYNMEFVPYDFLSNKKRICLQDCLNSDKELHGIYLWSPIKLLFTNDNS